MKFSLSWLKTHLQTKASAAELSEALTQLGLEVEALENPADALTGLMAVEVLRVLPHPNADRLRLAEITTGEETLTLVCGAPNLHEGMKALWAPPGIELPGGFKLSVREVRGIASPGMLCSEKETHLGGDAEGIIELAPEIKSGTPIGEIAELADALFDIAITPNRPDCLGVRGIARDLAAAGMGVLQPMPQKQVAVDFSGGVKVVCEDKQFCPHFAARLIRGAKNCESPHWLRRRLEQAGMRPLHAFADITNFIALDLARPLHAYDADTIEGSFRARQAKKSEHFLALDHKTYHPEQGSAGVIADDAKVLGLGGIIGGETSACQMTTNNVVLESAWFDPVQIGAAGRALNIDTEARRRFERGVDTQSVLFGLEEASALLLKLCGGEAGEIISDGAPPRPAKKIFFRPATVKRLTGLEVKAAEVKTMLERLGCEWEEAPKEKGFSITPPSFRPDLTLEADLVEEVMRLKGPDALSSVLLPPPAATQSLPVLMQQFRLARRFMGGLGFLELVTWSMIAPEKARLFGGGEKNVLLANPLSEQMAALRPTLLAGLLDAARKHSAMGERDFALFEAGNLFLPDETRPKEAPAIAGVLCGATPRHWRTPARAFDAFDAKTALFALLEFCGLQPERLAVSSEVPDFLHPTKSGSVSLPQGGVAFFGALHPDILAAFDCKDDIFAFEWVWQPKSPHWPFYAPPPEEEELQPVRRDLAFIVEKKVPAQKITAAIYARAGKALRHLHLFDVFEMEADKKSLGFELVLHPARRSDEEIEALMQEIAGDVKRRTGATLREKK